MSHVDRITTKIQRIRRSSRKVRQEQPGASRNDTPFSAPSTRAAGKPSAGAAHRCFIGKPRKPCCGHGMKAALVVLTGRHSQQQIMCLPVVPIGKQAQIRNVVVCHLSVGRCE
jgi:hypothetical protein